MCWDFIFPERSWRDLFGDGMAFQATLHQMIIFFLVLAVGFVAGKAHVIEEDFMPKFAKLITTVFLPVMIFAYTRSGSTRDALLANWLIIVFGIVWYAAITAIMYGLAKLMQLPHDRDRVFAFCFIFGNTGFIGTPLPARRVGHNRVRKANVENPRAIRYPSGTVEMSSLVGWGHSLFGIDY